MNSNNISELFYTESLFQTIFENPFMGSLVCSENGEILSINQKAMSIFGYGGTPKLMDVKDLFLDVEQIFDNSSQGKLTDACGRKKNGEQFHITVWPKSVDDKNSKIFFLAFNIKTEEESTAESARIISELSQHNNDLKQFSYITSHNLRAPIARLIGLSNLLEHFPIDNPSLKEILNGIRQSALMFDETVKDLSNILVIKDQSPLTKSILSLTDCLERVQKQLGIHESELTVNSSFDKAPEVNFTPAYLESIFINLFTNAIKYKHPERKLEINIRSEKSIDQVSVYFSDNGIGIDLQKHGSKVFKLYQRFHKESDGKGLGLYLVKSQLEALEGSITVESEPGVGTTFILSFKIDNSIYNAFL